jgi:chromosome segregation ATPase
MMTKTNGAAGTESKSNTLAKSASPGDELKRLQSENRRLNTLNATLITENNDLKTQVKKNKSTLDKQAKILNEKEANLAKASDDLAKAKSDLTKAKNDLENIKNDEVLLRILAMPLGEERSKAISGLTEIQQDRYFDLLFGVK